MLQRFFKKQVGRQNGEVDRCSRHQREVSREVCELVNAIGCSEDVATRPGQENLEKNEKMRIGKSNVG